MTDFAAVDAKYPGKRLKMRLEVWDWVEEHGGREFIRKLIYKLYAQDMAVKNLAARRLADQKSMEAPTAYIKEEVTPKCVKPKKLKTEDV